MSYVNIGIKDRTIRALLALVLAIIGYGYSEALGNWKWLFNVLAIILILEAIFGFCPLYKIFGINTNNSREAPRRVVSRARPKRKRR